MGAAFNKSEMVTAAEALKGNNVFCLSQKKCQWNGNFISAEKYRLITRYVLVFTVDTA